MFRRSNASQQGPSDEINWVTSDLVTRAPLELNSRRSIGKRIWQTKGAYLGTNQAATLKLNGQDNQ